MSSSFVHTLLAEWVEIDGRRRPDRFQALAGSDDMWAPGGGRWEAGDHARWGQPRDHDVPEDRGEGGEDHASGRDYLALCRWALSQWEACGQAPLAGLHQNADLLRAAERCPRYAPLSYGPGEAVCVACSTIYPYSGRRQRGADAYLNDDGDVCQSPEWLDDRWDRGAVHAWVAREWERGRWGTSDSCVERRNSTYRIHLRCAWCGAGTWGYTHWLSEWGERGAGDLRGYRETIVHGVRPEHALRVLRIHARRRRIERAYPFGWSTDDGGSGESEGDYSD